MVAAQDVPRGRTCTCLTRCALCRDGAKPAALSVPASPSRPLRSAARRDGFINTQYTARNSRSPPIPWQEQDQTLRPASPVPP